MSSVTRARESLTVALEKGIEGRVIKSPATPPAEVSTTPGSSRIKKRKSEISSKTSNDAKSNKVVVVNGNETGDIINDIDSMKLNVIKYISPSEIQQYQCPHCCKCRINIKCIHFKTILAPSF